MFCNFISITLILGWEKIVSMLQLKSGIKFLPKNSFVPEFQKKLLITSEKNIVAERQKFCCRNLKNAEKNNQIVSNELRFNSLILQFSFENLLPYELHFNSFQICSSCLMFYGKFSQDDWSCCKILARSFRLRSALFGQY